MELDSDKKKIAELLQRGVDEIIAYDSLKEKLARGKQLRIKFGVDPTAPHLHLGHAVPLRKLKQFQLAGHKIILLIGDFTAMIGDPSGRNETRPMLSRKQIEENMKTYIAQASKIIDMEKTELRFNSEWYKNKGWNFVMLLTSKITVARVLDRDDFKKRLEEGSDIQMQEILYPLMQGYDSVELKADVEIGGSDQKFNMLMGRKMQKRYSQPEQDIITLPLLEGLDGEKKMSKSYGNYIALTETPDDMFGKTMSVPDKLIVKYFEMATDVPQDKIEKNKERLASGENPRNLKLELAEEIVALYHGRAEAKGARGRFLKLFQKKEMPENISGFDLAGKNVVDALVASKLAASKSEARRNIEQGGVKINSEVVKDIRRKVKSGEVIKKGKRHFRKII